MTKIKNGFLSGALVLMLCSIIAKIVSAVYKIPLLKTLQSDGLGKYQMVISVYALFLVISSSGMVVTLSKLIAKETNFKNKHNQNKYLFAGIVFSLVLSSVLSLGLIIISPLLSRYQSFYNLQYTFIAIAPSIIFSSLISVFRGFFLGKRKMLFGGSVQVAEAVLKLLFSLYLSNKFAVNGSLGAVFGAVLGISISEFLSLIFLICLFLFSKKKGAKTEFINSIKNHDKIKNSKKNDKIYIKNADFKQKNVNFYKKNNFNNDIANSFKIKKLHAKSRYKTFWQATKDIFQISFFVTLQACILPFIGAIDGLIVVPLLLKSGLSQSIAYSLFGIEDGVVSAILSMPTIIASSISAAIIPNIKAQKNSQQIIKNGIKIVWLVSIFCATIFIFFSKEITMFLYGGGLTSKTINELNISSDMLRINGFNIIYISLLNLTGGILQGLDHSKDPVKNLFIATIVRFVVLLLCLTNKGLNIYGLAIADMSFYALAMILNLNKIKQISKINYNINQMFLLPTSSLVVMILSMFLTKLVLNNILPFRVVTLSVMLIGGIVYMLLLILTKVFNVKEIISLKKKVQS